MGYSRNIEPDTEQVTLILYHSAFEQILYQSAIFIFWPFGTNELFGYTILLVEFNHIFLSSIEYT